MSAISYFTHRPSAWEGPANLRDADVEAVLCLHRSLPSYQPTKLLSMQALAEKLGVQAIYVKDESTRFGLKAFKGLGGTYAMFRVLCERLGIDPSKADFSTFRQQEIRQAASRIVFVTATDGNHGKGISWASGLFGCRANVLMPKGSAQARAEAIRTAGPANVEITDLNYDETVAMASRLSEEKGWILIQDTAWDNYEQIPLWIIQGYLTMAGEAVKALEEADVRPTHVFLQAGVGAMAGGVCGYLMNHYHEHPPVISIVEPETVACIRLSAAAQDGKAHSVKGDPVTIMAGLNCGTPCKITWPVLRDYVSAYFAIPDYVAAEGMRTYARPCGMDPAVVSGESGAATMGALLWLMRDEDLADARRFLGLDEKSVILLFNTEGDTDPDGYRAIVEQNACPVPF